MDEDEWFEQYKQAVMAYEHLLDTADMEEDAHARDDGFHLLAVIDSVEDECPPSVDFDEAKMTLRELLT